MEQVIEKEVGFCDPKSNAPREDESFRDLEALSNLKNTEARSKACTIGGKTWELA